MILTACDPPSPFKTADSARGTFLVARLIAQLGPECSKAFPQFKFNLELARDDELEATEYLRRGRVDDKQLQRLVTDSELPAGFDRLAQEAPGQASDVCDGYWQRLPRYRLPAAQATSELPPPVSEAMLTQSEADKRRQDEQSARLEQQADAALRAAEGAAAEATEAMRAR